MGALYDKEINSSYILAKDQRDLVETTQHSLRRPLAVTGLAGKVKYLAHYSYKLLSLHSNMTWKMEML